MRESPVRRQPTARPTWLVALLIGVAALVVIGLGFAVFSLLRGATSSDASPGAVAAEPSPCVTTMVVPGDVLPKPSQVKVNVYNATSTSGLAGKTATAIESRGFAVGRVENDPVGKAIAGTAQIRYGPKGEQAAQTLLLQVPGAELVALQRKGKTVDLAVGDAFTGLAPKAEVEAAMASPSPSASGAGCAPTSAAPVPSAS
jgi:hypothetical protein